MSFPSMKECIDCHWRIFTLSLCALLSHNAWILFLYFLWTTSCLLVEQQATRIIHRMCPELSTERERERERGRQYSNAFWHTNDCWCDNKQLHGMFARLILILVSCLCFLNGIYLKVFNLISLIVILWRSSISVGSLLKWHYASMTFTVIVSIL